MLRGFFFGAASRIQIAGKFQGPPKGGTIPIRFPYTSLIIRAFRSSIGKCMGGLPVRLPSSSGFLWGLPRTNGNNGHVEGWNRYGHCGGEYSLHSEYWCLGTGFLFVVHLFQVLSLAVLSFSFRQTRMKYHVPIRMHNYATPKTSKVSHWVRYW